MTTYRSKQTISAVQFQGAEIPGVTCHGGGDEPIARAKVRMDNGCDSSRAHLPHVHANVTGGMQILSPGWWIFPVDGGPWGACTDEKFRASWEVPDGAAEAPAIEEPAAIDAAPSAPDPAAFSEPVPTIPVPVAVVPEAPVTPVTPVTPVKTTFPTFTD